MDLAYAQRVLDEIGRLDHQANLILYREKRPTPEYEAIITSIYFGEALEDVRNARATDLSVGLTTWRDPPGLSSNAAAEPKPVPGGITDGEQGEQALKPVVKGLNEDRDKLDVPGKVVGGPGRRPLISRVRSGGATMCRTAGIVPPLGVGGFGEPGIGGLPICPAAPGQAAPAPPPPTPFEAAYYAWMYIIRLPSPTGATQPTIGITGLDTFLTIHGPQNMSVDVTALGHTIHFDITSVYDIDWDDPRPDGSRTGAGVTRRHPDQGGPYPNGTLRHQYIERGTADITITQRWSALWSGGGESGSLPDSVETTGSLQLPIQEIVAVVTG